MALPLYSLQPQPFSVVFGNLHAQIEAKHEVLIGTPGSVQKTGKPGGAAYYVRRYYDGEGTQRDQYIGGPAGDPVVEYKRQEIQTQIDDTNAMLADVRILSRQGFQIANAATYATVASLHNHGIFRAGGVLIGSHAFGSILNMMGVRASAYTTDDVDLARREQLAFPAMPRRSLREILADSGIDFAEVPTMSPKHHSTSFIQVKKSRNNNQIGVDLLVPSPDDTYPIVAVPELQAYATGLPYLRYLLTSAQTAPLLSREGCCLVRVPLPERFAIHKLIVSQLRTGRNAKSRKDVSQACVLLAVLGDMYPGAIEAAVAIIPISTRKHLRASLAMARTLLEDAHPRAWAALEGSAR